ncbi:NAD(P)H-hydrate dehydratase [Guyparkeria sp. 1SP6A2]|nr:NAD(P)H-hydrate dehydratase [Guyparkeria sp. 1SP6A2]
MSEARHPVPPRVLRDEVAASLRRAYPVEAIVSHEQALFADGVEPYGLMEQAGAAAFDQLQRRWPTVGRIAVLVGPGQNGGDGLVIARLAYQAGLRVALLGWKQPEFRQSAARAWSALREEWPSIEVRHQHDAVDAALGSADVVVDALFGIGLSGPIEGAAATFMQRVAEGLDLRGAHPPGLLAVDTPSGLHCDTGAVDRLTLRADLTVTFLGCKIGQVTGAGVAVCGERVLADLGWPLTDAAGAVTLLHGGWRLAPRPADGHKGTFGTVLVVAGNRGMPGAARLAAEAALRGGAGKVIVATHPAHAATLNIGRPELIVHGVESQRDLLRLLGEATAVAIGPGLGRDAWAMELWRGLRDCPVPMVVDADALRLLGSRSLGNREAVITPHPGEAAGLLECGVDQVNGDRLAAARRLAASYRCAVVLKGAGSIVADGDHLSVCQRGGPALATAGSGDVLSGLIAALLAMGLPMSAAVEGAVSVHAVAGELESAAHGSWGAAAGDLSTSIRALINGHLCPGASPWRLAGAEDGQAAHGQAAS